MRGTQQPKSKATQFWRALLVLCSLQAIVFLGRQFDVRVHTLSLALAVGSVTLFAAILTGRAAKTETKRFYWALRGWQVFAYGLFTVAVVCFASAVVSAHPIQLSIPMWLVILLEPLIAISMLSMMPREKNRYLSLRSALEVIAVTCALVMGLWDWALKDLLFTSHLSTWVRVWMINAVFLSSLRTGLAVLVLERSRQPERRAQTKGLAGITLLSFDGSIAEFALWVSYTHHYTLSQVQLCAYWFLGLVALAWNMWHWVPIASKKETRRRVHPGSGLSYLFALGAIIVAMPKFLTENPMKDPILVTVGLTMVAALVARHYLMVHENSTLADELSVNMDLRDAQLAAREHFRALIQNSSDLIMTIDLKLNITYSSDASRNTLGEDSDDLLGTSFVSRLSDDDQYRLREQAQKAVALQGEPQIFDLTFHTREGEERRLSTIITYVPGEPTVQGFVVNIRDITDQRGLEAQLAHQAFHDALTGMPNRALFKDRLQQAINHLDRHDSSFALIYCDLDGFKAVNDTAGHAAGDDLLVEATQRMNSVVRATDTVARIGGDEFAILLLDVDSSAVNSFADRIVTVMAQPFAGTETDANLVVSASLGVVMVDGSERHDVGELMRDADLAMYVAKSMGKNRHVRFETNMRDKFVSEVALRNDLREAIENNGLELHYQPIIALDTNVMSSVEALLRWNHHERGFIPPLDFIPMAEETGMIIPIGEFVLRTACNEIAELQRRQPDTAPRSVAVNVSGRQLEESNFVPMVKEIVATSGLPVSSLTLEVTESMLIDGGNGVLERLQELHDYGVKFAIDDFGTGYSSLNYLRQFPIDILKVDRAFVSGLGTAQQDSMLTNAILTIGRTLQLRTVAEGIETQNELDELNRIGCDMGQGYLFARPLPLAALNEMVDEQANAQHGEKANS